MADDTNLSEIGSTDGASGKHRWLRITAGLRVVAVLGVGAWQVVELHHEVSDLESQNQSQQARLQNQQARLQNQQSQLDGLDSALGNTASGTSLSQIESQISTIQGYTAELTQRIGFEIQALTEATVNTSASNASASLFIPVYC